MRQSRNLLHYSWRLTGMIAMIHASFPLECLPRRILDRHVMWWEQACGHFNDQQRKENFRLDRATFMFLVGELRDDLQRKTKVAVISVEKRVATALWRLATPNAYR